MPDDDVVAYLKAQGLYDTFAAAAGVAVRKDATVADVHVPSTQPGKPKPQVGDQNGPKIKPDPDGDDDADEEGAENGITEPAAAIAKRATDAGDIVFAKGDANLYVQRPLTTGSAKRLYDWGVAQGIPNLVPPDLMHVTQAHSKAEVDTADLTPQQTLVDVPPHRWLSPLGKGKALVMHFQSPELQDRFKQFADKGASWDFPSYMPHVTLSYDTGDIDPQLAAMSPAPDFPLQLGPEAFQQSNDNWTKDNGLAKGYDFFGDFKIEKANDEKQMIFGWASVTHVDGQLVVDKQDDAILLQDAKLPGEDKISKGLESAAYDFVLFSRQHGDMHERVGTGNLVESMMFTPEKAAAGLVAKNAQGQQLYGWWTGFRLDDDMWKRYKEGSLPEFSIGGRASHVELVE